MQNNQALNTNQVNAPKESNNKALIFILAGVGGLFFIIIIVLLIFFVFNNDNESVNEDNTVETSEGSEPDSGTTNEGTADGTTNSEPAVVDDLTETSEPDSGTTNEGTLDETNVSTIITPADISNLLSKTGENIEDIGRSLTRLELATTEEEINEEIRKTISKARVIKQEVLTTLEDLGIEESRASGIIRMIDFYSDEENLRKMPFITPEKGQLYLTQLTASTEIIGAEFKQCFEDSPIYNAGGVEVSNEIIDCALTFLNNIGTSHTMLLQDALG